MSGMVEVRPARPGEEARIVEMVRALARYEKLEHQMVADAADFRAALFGDHPRVFCDVAVREGRLVGFALWFYNFSTFLGRHGIWLEDLYVEPEARGAGIGKALMAALAKRCVEEKLGRLEWWVLDWNAPAIEVYRAIGAEPMEGWTVQRLTGAALRALAEA